MKALGIVLIVLAVISIPLSCGVLFATSFATQGVTVLADTDVPIGTKTSFSATAIEGTQGIGLTLVAPGATSDIDVDAEINVNGTTHKITMKRGVEGVNAYQPWAPEGQTRPDVTNFFWRSPNLNVKAGEKIAMDVLLTSKGAITPTAKININGVPPLPRNVMMFSFGVPITLIALGIAVLVRSRKPQGH